MNRLALLIFDGDYTRLPLHHSDSAVFNRLSDAATAVIEVRWNSGEGPETLCEDLYGKPLTDISAGDLATHFEGTHLDSWDRGILGFVAGLSADTKVVLWWTR